MTVESIELLGNAAPVCSICNSKVPLETAKTDENGRAVHEQCYLVVLKQKSAVQSDPAP